MKDDNALDLWARLGSEGKAPTDLSRGQKSVNAYSVGIDPWIHRLSNIYLQNLCKRNAHFKLIIAPYGGGKTHFLVSLGGQALNDNYAVSYIACSDNISFDKSLEIYRAFISSITFPGAETAGLSAMLARIINHKAKVIKETAPKPEAAMEMWLGTLYREEYPEPSFGRVASAALREILHPHECPTGDAAYRWLRGEVDTLTKDERSLMRLATIPTKDRNEFGRKMLLSAIKFIVEGGVNGVVILFDEVETLLTAKGKALLRVLSAMRVLIDLPMGFSGGIPLLGAFSAVPEVLEELDKYPALKQRLSVVGASFSEGNDLAPLLDLGSLCAQKEFLTSLGQKLMLLGEKARGHVFDQQLQDRNIRRLVKVADERDLDINARRLFVKACVNILDQQISSGEREYTEEELKERYRGSFEQLSVTYEEGSDL